MTDKPQTTTIPVAYLPWTIARYENGRIAIVNGIGDVVCKSTGQACHLDERDFKSIVEAVNAQA